MAIDEHCVPKRILDWLPFSALESDGWERRFITGVARADEAVALYSQLGFEVHVEPVLASELGGDCNDCALVATCQFKTIYTPNVQNPICYRHGCRKDQQTGTYRSACDTGHREP